jgi:hypothetical protein
MAVQEVGWSVGYIDLARDTEESWTIMNALMNIRVQ